MFRKVIAYASERGVKDVLFNRMEEGVKCRISVGKRTPRAFYMECVGGRLRGKVVKEFQ